MKEDLCLWFYIHGYEEGFIPNEVSSSKQRKMSFDTYAIVSMVDRVERREIFGEDGVL